MQKIFHKVLLPVTMLLFFASSLAANSIYSRLGIGMPKSYPGAQAFALGGGGIALINPNTPQYLNPASINFIGITRFSGSFFYEGTDVTLGGLSGRFADAGFNSTQFSFPLGQHFSFGVGLSPYTNVAYAFETELDGFDSNVRQTVSGTGGINRLFLSFGAQMGGWLALGAGMDSYIGNIQNTWRVFFNDEKFRDTRNQENAYVRGIGFRFGAMARLGKYINLGAVLRLPVGLKSDVETIYNFSGGTSGVQQGTVTLPSMQGFGVTLKPISQLLLLGDMIFEKWGEVPASELLNTTATNITKISYGIEYRHSTEHNVAYLKRMSFRAGFRNAELPYFDSNGNRVSEQFITFGLSLPYEYNNSQVDLGFEFGTRGSLVDNGTEEKVFRFIASVGSGERWFYRPKRRRQ